MRTYNILSCYKNRKDIPIMPLDVALWLTLISSNYPCLEHIFMVPKVCEPLKFYCISLCIKNIANFNARLFCGLSFF